MRVIRSSFAWWQITSRRSGCPGASVPAGMFAISSQKTSILKPIRVRVTLVCPGYTSEAAVADVEPSEKSLESARAEVLERQIEVRHSLRR